MLNNRAPANDLDVSAGRASQHADEVLAGLPADLAAATDREVLRVAGTALTQLFAGLGYVRVLVVSQGYTPSELLELCADEQMAATMAAAAADAGSGGGNDGGNNTGGGSSSTSAQQTAMRRGMPLYTPQLLQHDPTCDYADWRLLQQRFGMQSFAAVPLMVAGTVHGVIMAASATPHTFKQSCLPRLQAVADMASPYAAVLYKHGQVLAARALLGRLLPPRVAAAALDRIHQGGTNAVSVFVPTHHDVEGGAGE